LELSNVLDIGAQVPPLKVAVYFTFDGFVFEVVS
jgi:hypothetical protein